MKYDWRDTTSISVLVGGIFIIALILTQRNHMGIATHMLKGSTSQSGTTTKVTSSLSPKEVVQQYYQLAPTNKSAALALLSELWRKEEQSKEGSSAKFWDSINQVDVYALKTLKQTSQFATVKAWLKYYPKDKNDTPCESITFKVIHDSQTNQWLMDSASDVVQKMNCGI